jgi:hypothetical protein
VTSAEVRVFREAAQVCLTLLCCLTMKRAIAKVASQPLNLWRLYDGCLFDTIAISFGKRFGSARHEDLYWTKLFPDSCKAHTRIAVWADQEYLKEMRDYRNRYVAHHELDHERRPQKHPHLGNSETLAEQLYIEIHAALSRVDRAENLPAPERVTGGSRHATEAHWEKIATTAAKAVEGRSDRL